MAEVSKILADYRHTIQTFTNDIHSVTNEDLAKLDKNISKLTIDLEQAQKGISAIPANLANETVKAIEALKTQITKSQIEKAAPGVALVISNINTALERTNQLLKQKAQEKSKGVTGVEGEQIDL